MPLRPPERRPNRILFPHETTCRKITHVTFDTDNPQLAYTLLGGIIQQAVNKCLGVEGVRLFSRTLQNALIARGYITSLIDIPPQPSDSPVLQLILVWENPETSLSFRRFSAPTQG
ncbi:POTRA domain-containing protein [Leclercia pneumoniae]